MVRVPLRRGLDETECRHEFRCEGWTVDPLTSICRVCGQQLVFFSWLQDPASFDLRPYLAAGEMERLAKPPDYSWENVPVEVVRWSG